MKSPPRPPPVAVRSTNAHRQLKTMILSGELRSGERLVERELARRLNVSRIPLREALIRLEGEGLVRSVANTATYVEDFSLDDMVEIYSLRVALEPLATRLAALRTTPELVRSLRRICERMTQLTRRGDWKRLDQVDYEFHHTVVQGSQHRRLIRAYNFCQIQVLGRAGAFGKLKHLAPDFTAREHARIVRAIERGDTAEAEEVARTHIDRARQAFLRFQGFVVQGSGESRPRS